MRIHTVLGGETLWRIAQQYGTTIDQIALANGLSDTNRLSIGQALVVPEEGREYIVQSGDTLGAIESRYNVSVEALLEYNQLSDASLIYTGQMLQLPYTLHTVSSGESAWSIAQRYSLSLTALVEANNLADPSRLLVGQRLRIPAPPRPEIEVNAYNTQMDARTQMEVLFQGRYLTYLTPFMYAMRADGGLTNLWDPLVLEAARRTQTAPLLVVTNYRDGNFRPDLAAAVLRDPSKQELMITSILVKMQEKGYRGVNFDLEYVYPEDRENYNELLRKTTARLRPLGYSVSTALAPKISATQQGLLYEAHDYEEQGRIVDFIIPMTYEWGWAGGPPLAIAPIQEVRGALDYAVTVVPREKIMMGVPLYGRDWRIPWQEGTQAVGISPQAAVEQAIRYGVEIRYDEISECPYYRYTDAYGQQHEVWFEDARSMQAKFNLVKEYGLLGISYWVLGSPFPQNWHVQQENFKARKYLM